MATLNLRLPDDVHRAATEAARADDRSLNGWILHAIREQLARSPLPRRPGAAAPRVRGPK